MEVPLFSARAGLIALCACLAAVSAHPAAAADPTPSGEALATVGNGNGSAPCLSCHGPDGGGNAAAGFPRIAGQDAAYIARQVRLVRDGKRPAPAMAPLVSTMTDAEIDTVAGYYAAMSTPSPDASTPTDDAARVADALVRVGD